MKKIFVILFCVIFISYAAGQAKKKSIKCRKHETYMLVKFEEAGCSKVGAPLKKPMKICRCDDHYVRNVDGKCIKEKDCPACSRNETYVLSKATNPTCLDPAKPEKPIPACRCKKGYVRWDQKCILSTECPRCDKDNEHLIFAGKRDDTCEGPGRLISRPLFDCRCIDEYVRKDGECIPIGDCPCDCPENEEFILAEKEDSTCTKEGEHMETPWHVCRCIDGYVRDGNKTCIPSDDCPHEEPCD